MLAVTICSDETARSAVDGALNPNAVALVEPVSFNAAGFRHTMVKVTLTTGRELFIALNGGKRTSNLDEHRRRFDMFLSNLTKARSPLAAM